MWPLIKKCPLGEDRRAFVWQNEMRILIKIIRVDPLYYRLTYFWGNHNNCGPLAVAFGGLILWGKGNKTVKRYYCL